MSWKLLHIVWIELLLNRLGWLELSALGGWTIETFDRIPYQSFQGSDKPQGSTYQSPGYGTVGVGLGCCMGFGYFARREVASCSTIVAYVGVAYSCWYGSALASPATHRHISFRRIRGSCKPVSAHIATEAQ